MKITTTPVFPGGVIEASHQNLFIEDMVRNAGDYAVSTGSGGAYTLTLSSMVDSLEDGDKFRMRANHSNPGAATLNVNGLGAIPIYTFAGNALAGQEILANRNYEFTYNSSLGAVLLMTTTAEAWNTITSTSTTLGANGKYIFAASGMVQATLPSTANIGDSIQIIDNSGHRFKITQNASQSILCYGERSTVGTSGFMDATIGFTAVVLVYTNTNEWSVQAISGKVGVDTYLSMMEPDSRGALQSATGSTDSKFIATGSTAVVDLRNYLGGITAFYRSGVIQNISSLTLMGISSVFRMNPSVIENNIFAHASPGGSNINIYSADVSSDISVAGNWSLVSLSGFPTECAIVGFGKGYYWLKSTTVATDFYYATWNNSTKTFTYVGTVTCPSAINVNIFNNAHRHRVNESGIWVLLDSAANIHLKATHSGVENTSRYFGQSSIALGTPYAIYTTLSNISSKIDL